MEKGRYVLYEGEKLYFDEIEQFPVEKIEKIIQAVAEQQLNTSIRIDSAKSRMVNDDPISDDDFINLKTKIKILNACMVKLSAIRKQKNISKGKEQDKLLIARLREYVGESVFMAIVEKLHEDEYVKSHEPD
jgi:hypothetical protein